MKDQRSILVIALSLLACASVLSAQDAGTLTLTNAEVISVDPLQRIMVIRSTQGDEQTVELDENLVGFENLRPGDQVVLSLLDLPARDRVTSISKGPVSEPVSQPEVGGPEPPTADVPTPEPPAGDVPSESGVRIYADRVAALALQANEVDRLWNRFRNVCNVAVDGRYESGREWVSLWDGQARVDTTNGTCRDLYNQVVAAGETVNAGMAAAEESARRADLAPGTVQEVRRRYLLDWHGWGRNPPQRLEQ